MENPRDTLSDSNDDFGLEQYSKETLIDLVKLYSKLYIALDGFWYLSMKNEFNNDTAFRHDIWVWEKMHKREFKGLLDTLKIEKKDIKSFFKVFMLTPWMPQLDYKIDIKGPNVAIMTVTYCPTLKALEKEGEGREGDICRIMDAEYFRRCAAIFSPDLKVLPIVLPPREDRDGICCKWEFVLES